MMAFLAHKLAPHAACFLTSRAVGGDLKYTLVAFFAPQREGIPVEFPMHAGLRLAYHTLEPASDRWGITDSRCHDNITIDYLTHDADFDRQIVATGGHVHCVLLAFLADGILKGSLWTVVRDVVYILALRNRLALGVASLVLVVLWVGCRMVRGRHASASKLERRPAALM